MANQEQLRILLEEGVEAWNKWRDNNIHAKYDLVNANLEGVNLYGANFNGVNLGRANLRGANLTNSNFNHANLTSADLTNANLNSTYIERASLTGAILVGSDLNSADLFHANLAGANLKSAYLYHANLESAHLYCSNLNRAELCYADLFKANLNSADLSHAILKGSNLKEVQALATNFSSANFTRACIEDWNINSETDFENVICDYIFLSQGNKERRPSDFNKYFEPGDFANLVQKAVNTVDLIFSNGIDWQSFLKSFQDLQVECDNGKLTIQAIERKTNGAFVVRVEVPPDKDKASIEASFWQKYNPLLEAKDKEIKLLSQQTEFYSEQVEVIRKDNTRLLGIVETMAEKETIKVQQNFNAPVTGVAGNVEGNQNIFTSQSIADASTEIQNLLTTLQNNGLTQEQAEKEVAQDLATTANNDPTALGKLVNWGKSLGNKAAETSVSEVARRVIKLALNLAGVSMS